MHYGFIFLSLLSLNAESRLLLETDRQSFEQLGFSLEVYYLAKFLFSDRFLDQRTAYLMEHLSQTACGMLPQSRGAVPVSLLSCLKTKEGDNANSKQQILPTCRSFRYHSLVWRKPCSDMDCKMSKRWQGWVVIWNNDVLTSQSCRTAVKLVASLRQRLFTHRLLIF